MYGMVLSLRSFSAKISPNDSRQNFRSFQTSANQLNYFESATGVKFIINTDRNATGVQDLLRQIYSQIFVETIVKNPLLKPGQEITSELFKSQIDDCIQRHSSFV